MNQPKANNHRSPNNNISHFSRHQRLSYRRRDLSREARRKASKLVRPIPKKESTHVNWLPGDDYLLINSTVMVCNLAEVYHTVRFAVKYTQQEIEDRWHSLLFDPNVSSISLSAIENLPNILKSQLDRQIPFSSKEDNIISQVNFTDVFTDCIPKSMSPSDLNHSIFAQLLRKHPNIFYAGRDVLDLYRQWYRFQSCRCIPESNNLKSDLSFAKNDDSTMVESDSVNPDYVKDAHSMTASPLGGNSESFSDTELLLEETVASALASGLNKLTESSTISRRQRMLGQSSYHGFQGLITQTVLEAIAKDSNNSLCKLPNQSTFHNPMSHASATNTVDNSISNNNDFNRSTVFTNSELKSNQSAITSSSSADQLSSSNFSRITSTEQPSSSSSTTTISSSKSTSNITAPNFELQRRLELHKHRGRLWARLRRTKEEARRWTYLVEAYFADGMELYDPQPIYPNLALLTGGKTKYFIKEKEVIFGRSSSTYQPHIDFSMEGNSIRISRCHGRIRLLPDGSFWLTNFSTHTTFVDGNPILRDEEVELKDGATIHIGSFTFRFDINFSYVKWSCGEAHAREAIDANST